MHHLSTELLQSLAGIQMTHVPYKATPPAMNDLMAGHIQLLFGDTTSTLPMIQQGKLRGIAVTTAKRSPAAPDIPTVAETVPGFESASWQMLLRAGRDAARGDRAAQPRGPRDLQRPGGDRGTDPARRRARRHRAAGRGDRIREEGDRALGRRRPPRRSRRQRVVPVPAKIHRNRCVLNLLPLRATHIQGRHPPAFAGLEPAYLEGSHETSFVGRARGYPSCSLLLAGSGARAEEPKKGLEFAKRAFAADVSKQKKSYACFVRKYDAAHLAQSSAAEGQRHDAADQRGDRSGRPVARLFVPARRQVPQPARRFRLQRLLRHARCDREFQRQGTDAAAASIATAAASRWSWARPTAPCWCGSNSIRIWRNNKPDDEGLNLSGGADDRVFRLDRAPLEMCRSLVTDRKELAAMRTK